VGVLKIRRGTLGSAAGDRTPESHTGIDHLRPSQVPGVCSLFGVGLGGSGVGSGRLKAEGVFLEVYSTVHQKMR